MAAGTINLTNPIKINGQVVKALSYDTDLITVEEFLAAEGYKAKKIKGMCISVAEVDGALAVSLGIQAVIATNQEIDIADLERLHGADVMQLLKIGRNFTSAAAAAPSPENNSGEPSELIAAPTTLALEK